MYQRWYLEREAFEDLDRLLALHDGLRELTAVLKRDREVVVGLGEVALRRAVLQESSRKVCFVGREIGL